MITRRDFAAGVRAGALATTVRPVVAASQQKPRKNTLMHVGGDYHSVFGDNITSKQNLEYNLRHGVRHLTAEVKKRNGGWDVDELKRMKDNCDKYDVVFEAIRMDSDYIKLAKGLEREREIEHHCGQYSQVGAGRREDYYLSLGVDPFSPECERAWPGRRHLRLL
jgi:hypothetical protein